MNTTTTDTSHRGQIFLESATVIEQESWPGEQYILRVYAPETAKRAKAGSFAHLTCDPAVPMRRPLSIMRASPEQGWVDFLYKIHGHGLHHLSSRAAGDNISVLGPIGKGFTLHANKPRPLLIGGGVGIPPMIFLAESIKANPDADWKTFCIMGSEIPFPFAVSKSSIAVQGIDEAINGSHPLLESWNIPSRLASWQGYAASFKGFVTDLADAHLQTLSQAELDEIEIFACGPTPMLKAVAALARKYSLDCQVSLEEFMACAVGGCAGCTVPVQTPNGLEMQRVCVDGPVFEAAQVYPG
ncbi:MAG: dihydroorotate dehydrogenase electron transfer subunit [Gammaproteobacteria bacterium]|nr:dihydroorotate dehydrogenase electron transfer subunit [Gammaproteobacteria bacterium]NNM13539.1 dihydroorotate dehydrogenase electron transfer subunit [Gammaproteobacteria bacterium]